MARSKTADVDTFGWPADSEDKLGPSDWKAAKAQMRDPFVAEPAQPSPASGQYTHGDSLATQRSETAAWPTQEETGPLAGNYTAVQQPHHSGVLDTYGAVTAGERALTARDQKVIADLEELDLIARLEEGYNGPSAPQNS